MNYTIERKGLFKNLPHLLFDQNGLLGAGGLLLLTITQFINSFPALITAVGGFLMVIVSSFKTVHFVRRQNREARQRADLLIRKFEILRLVQAGDMTEQRADFLLKHLDEK